MCQEIQETRKLLRALRLRKRFQTYASGSWVDLLAVEAERTPCGSRSAIGAALLRTVPAALRTSTIYAAPLCGHSSVAFRI